MTRKDLFRMITVMTLVAALCGGALAMVKINTREQIEYQQILYIKEPALKKILPEGYDNDPVSDRMTIDMDQDGQAQELTVFIAKKQEEIISVAFESYGTGYGGPVGVMLAIDPEENSLQGAAVTTHSETPGLGTKIIDVADFGRQFEDVPLDMEFRLRSDGGSIHGITGATVSSSAMTSAVRRGVAMYRDFQDHLELD
ncbi:MAG: RnfABCDGE type electron transport complex subunit G [Desulfonatronovibrio sp.]